MLAIAEVKNRIGEFSHNALVRIIARDVTIIRKNTARIWELRGTIRYLNTMIRDWEAYADHIVSLNTNLTINNALQSELIDSLIRQDRENTDRIEFLTRMLAEPMLNSEAHQNALELVVSDPGSIPAIRTITTRRGESITVKIAPEDNSSVVPATPAIAPSESAGNSAPSVETTPDSSNGESLPSKDRVITLLSDSGVVLTGVELARAYAKIDQWNSSPKDTHSADQYVTRLSGMHSKGTLAK